MLFLYRKPYSRPYFHPRCIPLYNSLDPEEEGKELGHDIFEEQPPIPAEHPTQVEQDEIKIHKLQHVPLKWDQEEIKNDKKWAQLLWIDSKQQDDEKQSI